MASSLRAQALELLLSRAADDIADRPEIEENVRAAFAADRLHLHWRGKAWSEMTSAEREQVSRDEPELALLMMER